MCVCVCVCACVCVSVWFLYFSKLNIHDNCSKC